MSSAVIGVGLAAVSLGYGVSKDIKANNADKAAKAQIKPYKTPQEVIGVLNATQANAQSGFDATTLDYLTNQTDQAFAGSLGTAQRLGLDQNAMSAIFGQKVDAIKGIASQNHALQMTNFNAYISAENAMAANDAAELKSAQDQLKDQLQKIAIDKQVATGQISQGLNLGLQAASTYASNQLYNGSNVTSTPQTTNTTGYVPPPVVATSSSSRATGGRIGG